MNILQWVSYHRNTLLWIKVKDIKDKDGFMLAMFLIGNPVATG